MKYELTDLIYSAEKTLNENEYSCNICLFIKSTDGIAPEFSKDVLVISNNTMTGFEVDKQRSNMVDNYLIEINK